MSMRFCVKNTHLNLVKKKLKFSDLQNTPESVDELSNFKRIFLDTTERKRSKSLFEDISSISNGKENNSDKETYMNKCEILVPETPERGENRFKRRLFN